MCGLNLIKFGMLAYYLGLLVVAVQDKRLSYDFLRITFHDFGQERNGLVDITPKNTGCLVIS